MFFAKLHPLLVHFPMALLFSGALFQLFGHLQREEVILEAGSFNIYFGFWVAPIVMATGALALPGLQLEGLAKKFLTAHIRYALATFLIFAVYLMAQQFQGKWWIKFLHCLLLLAGLVSIFLTGFYGGELVHRFELPASGLESIKLHTGIR